MPLSSLPEGSLAAHPAARWQRRDAVDPGHSAVNSGVAPSTPGVELLTLGVMPPAWNALPEAALETTQGIPAPGGARLVALGHCSCTLDQHCCSRSGPMQPLDHHLIVEPLLGPIPPTPLVATPAPVHSAWQVEQTEGLLVEEVQGFHAGDILDGFHHKTLRA